MIACCETETILSEHLETRTERVRHDFAGDKIHSEHGVLDSHCVTNLLVLCEGDITQSRANSPSDDVELDRRGSEDVGLKNDEANDVHLEPSTDAKLKWPVA